MGRRRRKVIVREYKTRPLPGPLRRGRLIEEYEKVPRRGAGCLSVVALFLFVGTALLLGLLRLV